jgi:hypothetical protein
MRTWEQSSGSLISSPARSHKMTDTVLMWLTILLAVALPVAIAWDAVATSRKMNKRTDQ